MRWEERRWDEMRQEERRWDEMRGDEMRWDEIEERRWYVMRQHEMMSIFIKNIFYFVNGHLCIPHKSFFPADFYLHCLYSLFTLFIIFIYFLFFIHFYTNSFSFSSPIFASANSVYPSVWFTERISSRVHTCRVESRFDCLSVCLSVWLSVYLFGYLIVWLSDCLSVCMPFCLSVHMSVRLFICVAPCCYLHNFYLNYNFLLEYFYVSL